MNKLFTQNIGKVVTAALPYANGPIHIGHLAGVYVPADIYVRYLRKKGEKVLFISGSDENGIPITLAAQKQQTSPQQIVDKYHQLNQSSLKAFQIQFDQFTRTSSVKHHSIVRDFFKSLHEKNLLQRKITEQFFDEGYGQFLADRYVQGTCPKCKYEKAYGDQCEACGVTLSPDELIEPKSVLSKVKLIKKKTEHWYLPLNLYQEWLEEWLGNKQQVWKKHVMGQIFSWLEQGLQPRAITRDLDWGVKVPLEEAKGKVLYVWFDAPIGYITATEEWAEKNGMHWQDIWKDPSVELIHFVGKDNIVFHSIIFPAMLKAIGEDLILPKDIPANEFMNLEGKKISTSGNWAVWLHEYLEIFRNQTDTLRYVLCSNLPETKDSEFTWKDFQLKNNNDLVGILGNFVNRVLTLIHKYFEGVVPGKHGLEAVDREMIHQIKVTPENIATSIEHYKFKEALNYFMQLSRRGNKYLNDVEPWNIYPEKKERVETILYILSQLVANIGILAEPFLPQTSIKIHQMLGIKTKGWEEAGSIDLISKGTKCSKPVRLFEKIEDEVIREQMSKLKLS